MKEERRINILNVYRHLTLAAEAAEKAGLFDTARNIRSERTVVDEALATASGVKSN